VEKTVACGIKPCSAEQIFAIDALTRNSIPLVTLTGKEGTGKTLLALASSMAVRRQYRQIFVARPVVPLSNKDTGYLPGDIEDKLAPYMQPLWDNLKIIQTQFPEEDKQYQQIDQMIQDKKLVIEPLSYIRGRRFEFIAIRQARSPDSPQRISPRHFVAINIQPLLECPLNVTFANTSYIFHTW
jgi:PhoH-like ATPase